MSSFTPRVKGPRPEYPPVSEALKDFVLSSVRAPLVLTGLTWALQPLWLQAVAALKGMGMGETEIFCMAALLTHTVTYVVFNSFFYFCDTYNIMQQYKLHRTPAMVNPPSRLQHTLREAFVSQIILSPLIVYFGYEYVLKGSFLQPDYELTDFPYLFACYAVAKVTNSLGFYWAHRAVHHPSLYWIHKQHHAYVGTIGISAEYAHPIEQVVANQGPTMLGIILMSRHPLPVCIWLWERLEQTYCSHSGYAFYGTLLHSLGMTHTSGAAFHDYHHTINTGNFSEPWVDWVFGTMDPWLAQGGEQGYVDRKKSA